MWHKAFLFAAALVIPIVGVAQEATKLRSVVVELVDVDGKPIEGAHVGIMGAVGENIPGQVTEWYYCCGSAAVSDASGSTRVTEENEGNLERLCLIARHEGRKLSAVTSVDPAKLTEPVKLTLVPECVVMADVVCSELAGKWPPGQIVYVRHAGKTMLECEFKDSKICLPLPPGTYEFEVYGEMTCHLKRSVQVTAVGKQQQLEVFDLPASKLGLLQGRPAPEIPGILAWKNGPGPKLAELHGKVVLLEFFGYWCGPCVQRMPEVVALHDKYHDQGLVMIGVHTDLGDDENEPVDTAEKLDKRLAKTRTNLWKGRDIPFPVALIKCVRTKYRDDLPGFNDTGRSAAAAAYGVMGYPTQILIDRKGNVVGLLGTEEKGIKLIEKALENK